MSRGRIGTRETGEMALVRQKDAGQGEYMGRIGRLSEVDRERTEEGPGWV